MKLKQLLDRWTSVTRDHAVPQFWPTERRIELLNEAAEEAAIRGRLLDTDQLTVDLVAGDPYADYPAHAWSIREITLDGKRLQLVDREMLDESEGGNWEQRTGTPVAVCEIDGRLRFYPIPEQDAEARVRAFCVPETQLDENNLDGEPGLPEREHKHLLDYALSIAYLDVDADAMDPNRAERHEALFEHRYGPPVTAATRRRVRLHVVRRIAGHFF